MTDYASDRLAVLFRRQAASVIQRGSPLYVELLGRVGDNVHAGGVFLALLRSRAGELSGQALPLRLMAAFHRLALGGGAAALAAHLPSCGGAGDAEAAWQAMVDLVESNPHHLDVLLDAPLQTNEPGRSRALVTGFLAVAAATRLPLRVLELGASAGLNLNWPHYRFESGAGLVGDPGSPLRLSCAPWPTPLPALEVVEARGCDAHPLDPRRAEDRLTLRAAVWADQLARFGDLDAALDVADAHPPQVERSELLAWLDRVEAREGTATVVFHSVVEQYLDPAARAQLAAAMTRLLNGADARAPIAWLSLERAAGQGAYGLAELRLALSPDPQRRLLGHASYHGSALELASTLGDGSVPFGT